MISNSSLRCLSTTSLPVVCLKFLSVHPPFTSAIAGEFTHFYHISNHGEGLSVGLEYECGVAS